MKDFAIKVFLSMAVFMAAKDFSDTFTSGSIAGAIVMNVIAAYDALGKAK